MTRSSAARALLLAAGLLSVGAPRAVLAESADDVETARACFLEATRLGKQGRWKEASEMYARSLQLKPAPLTRYSLGVAQRESGRLADALASFRTFVKEPSTPSSAAFVEPAHAAIDAGWMCNREAGGIKYGRVIKAGPQTNDFSVDVVDMQPMAGPHHRHPNGEIDLVMPLEPEAQFDGHGAGWVVYGPGSAHHPTVTQGRALVLYLLPAGAIEFTRT